MTISVNQQVDLLWKKIGFGVSKTEVPAIKDASNESISSPPFLPGDKVWAESDLIPAILPVASNSVLTVYSDATANAVECVMDITASPNRTWLTNVSDWVPIDFGSTYKVRVFLDVGASPSPETTGVQLYAAGASNDDEWYFDYSSGVLNFIGNNLPSQDFTGKKIYICGAAYSGIKGINVSNSSTFGNITISGSTISSTGNINLQSWGNVISAGGTTISNAGYPTLPTDVATYQFVTDSILALHPNTIYQGDSILRLSDPSGNAGILTISIDGVLMSTWSNSSINFGDLVIAGNVLSSTNDIDLTPAANSVVTTTSTTAWRMPSGTTAERPASPIAGYARFNTTFGGFEIYNGVDWAGTQSQINSQIIIGDGIAISFALNQATAANNILVTIHGVVQVPYAAYNVSGGMITFNEAPQNGETIEVRYISQAVSPISNLPASAIIDPPNMIVGIVNVILDSFNIATFRSARYTLSIVDENGESQMADIMLSHNGDADTSLALVNTDFTGSSLTLLSYSSAINAGFCQLIANSSTANTEVKMQKTYFTL